MPNTKKVLCIACGAELEAPASSASGAVLGGAAAASRAGRGASWEQRLMGVEGGERGGAGAGGGAMMGNVGQGGRDRKRG